jgi:hypothetical protein
MALTGAVAAAVRKFDPYPEFDEVRVFRGRPETGGRQLYKSSGVIVPRFEMVTGVQIVGGADFGQRVINGAWRGARADEPLIGDGGLRNAEARTNLSPLRSPFQIYPAGLDLPERSVVNGIASPDGKNAASRLADLSTTSVQSLPVATSAVVIPGQLYTAVFGVMKATEATDTAGHARPILARVNRASSIAQRLFNAQTGSGEAGLTVRDMGDWWRLSMVFTPGAGETWANLAIFPAHDPAVTNTGYCDAWFGAILAGPDINDPPILQDSALPATRTAYSYRESWRSIAPVHYGVARARWLAPLASHAAPFPYIFEARKVGASAIRWMGAASGNVGYFNVVTSGDDDYIPLGTPIVGGWQTIAWALRASQAVVSVNGAAVLTTTLNAPVGTSDQVGFLGSALSTGNIANAEMDCCLTANGEISNDALRALSARFAA